MHRGMAPGTVPAPPRACLRGAKKSPDRLRVGANSHGAPAALVHAWPALYPLPAPELSGSPGRVLSSAAADTACPEPSGRPPRTARARSARARRSPRYPQISLIGLCVTPGRLLQVSDAYRIVSRVSECGRFVADTKTGVALVHRFSGQPCGQPWDIHAKSMIGNSKRAKATRNAQILREKVVHSFSGQLC